MLHPQKHAEHSHEASYPDEPHSAREHGLFYSTDVYDATSPYECCVACLLSPVGCYASGFFINFDTPCVNFERPDDTKTCNNPGFVAGRYDRTSNTGTFNRATYSNGPCGVAQKGPNTG